MLTIAFMIMGWVVFYALVRRMLALSSAQLRREMRERMMPAEQHETKPAGSQLTRTPERAAVPAQIGRPEKRILIRAVRMDSKRPAADVWAQLGRASVQSSHNLGLHGS